MMWTLPKPLALGLFLTIAATANAATYDNPVVPNADLGEFRHGTYPSIGNRTHAGLDLKAPCGSPVYAEEDGRVIDLIATEDDQNFNSLGYMVLIQHPSSTDKPLATLYLHLQGPPLVHKDQEVKAHAKIGEVGQTGFSLGCHLHLEVRHFLTRFHPAWANIYGDGDQRQSAVFLNDWEDPEKFLAQQASTSTVVESTESTTNINDCDRLAGDTMDPQGAEGAARWGIGPYDINADEAIPACKRAVAEFPNVPRYQYQLGRAFQKAGRLDDALRMFERASMQSHALAYESLVNYYDKTPPLDDYNGVTKDYKKAIELLTRAAELGSPVAQFSIGSIYEHGDLNVTQDLAVAKKWYLMAMPNFQRFSDQGNREAPGWIGLMYEYGKGVDQDLHEAIKWYEKAVAMGAQGFQANLDQVHAALQEEERTQEVKRKQEEVCLPGNPKGHTRWLMEEHTEAAGETILGNSILCQSDGLIRLVHFQKTDGQSAEMLGVQFYRLMYEAEIEFIKDVWWRPGSLLRPDFAASERTQNSQGSWQSSPRNAAERQKIWGTINFEKTERGWWGEPGSIRLNR